MRALLVLSPGAMTTVQDLGRIGYAHMGVPQSGVLDQEAARLANALLGNPPEAAVLECTVVGPHLAVLEPVQLALAGADMGATLNHRPIPNRSAFAAGAGDVLALGQIRHGCRTYLAVSGGFQVPMVMGSLSTYVGGKLGGFNGRPLLKGDFLDHFEYHPQSVPIALVDSHQPPYASQIQLRVVDGPQFHYFGSNVHRFFQGTYQVSAKADRSGYRLNGPSITTANAYRHTIISEPVVRGSIQVPPDGQPIVLWGEQTVGGYAKIANIITPDLSLLAQTIPGDTVSFLRTDMQTAHALYRQWYLKQMQLAE